MTRGRLASQDSGRHRKRSNDSRSNREKAILVAFAFLESEKVKNKEIYLLDKLIDVKMAYFTLI